MGNSSIYGRDKFYLVSIILSLSISYKLAKDISLNHNVLGGVEQRLQPAELCIVRNLILYSSRSLSSRSKRFSHGHVISKSSNISIGANMTFNHSFDVSIYYILRCLKFLALSIYFTFF